MRQKLPFQIGNPQPQSVSLRGFDRKPLGKSPQPL
ncbi:hypothetical protein Pla111_05830 [Botrimarina hoheduenensis]|uniref:Uncharacterized protein n=1 Tax=Botrimarina hoheduenensis TaxID=2528000 RepID=A0A5C5WD00_9BACT|nr:hypothetical protein Pla111_05830 [Botrimarina hoheduenensis]